MKRYKVIALSVGGKGNKIFRSGDEVIEANFPPGNADILVKKGYLEVIGENDQPAPDHSGQPELISKDVSIEDVTMNEMKSDLKELKIEFPKNASKAELFEIWRKAKN